MKIHFSPDQQRIIDILRDGSWHCVFSELVIKDDRKRISEINVKLEPHGYEIIAYKCDGRCRINHSSRIFMRRLMKKSEIKVPQAVHSY